MINSNGTARTNVAEISRRPPKMVIVMAIATMVLVEAALGVVGLGLGLARQEKGRPHYSNAEAGQTSPYTLQKILNDTSQSVLSLPNAHSPQTEINADERYGSIVRPRLPVFGIQNIQWFEWSFGLDVLPKFGYRLPNFFSVGFWDDDVGMRRDSVLSGANG